MAKSKTKTITTKINKSAEDGKIVSNNFAKTHPKTTYTQTIKKTITKKGT